jgi:hypothetical protein
MRAGLDSSPHYGGKDVTGSQVTNYKNLGRVYAVAAKGEWLAILQSHGFNVRINMSGDFRHLSAETMEFFGRPL